MDKDVKETRPRKADADAHTGTMPGTARAAEAGPPPPPPPPAASGGSVARLLTTRWKIVAIVALACALLAWIIAAMQPRRYRTSAIAAVAPLSESLSASEVLRGVEVLERRTVVATVAALASTGAVREGADGFDISASVLPNTNLFRVTVEGPDAARVAQIANTVPQRLSAQTRAMFRYYGVTTVSAATAPDGAFFPRTGRAIATGLILGLFLGAAAAWLVDRRPIPRLT